MAVYGGEMCTAFDDTSLGAQSGGWKIHPALRIALLNTRCLKAMPCIAECKGPQCIIMVFPKTLGSGRTAGHLKAGCSMWTNSLQ